LFQTPLLLDEIDAFGNHRFVRRTAGQDSGAYDLDVVGTAIHADDERTIDSQAVEDRGAARCGKRDPFRA
jgi:hypothetical protein